MAALASSRAAQIDTALARCVLYDAIALGFETPTAEAHARLGAREAAAALASAAQLAQDVPSDGGPRAGLPDLARRFARGFARAPFDDLVLAHARLFGHTTRGTVVPYEAEYGSGDRIQAAHELADISGFLTAFGLSVASEHRERPDHIAVECEFAAFLARKEAHALEAGDDGMCGSTRDATRLFLHDHLLRFGRAFGASLAREDARGPYGALADLLVRFLGCEAARWGVPLGPALLGLRDEKEETIPMACEGDPPFIPVRRAPGGERIA